MKIKTMFKKKLFVVILSLFTLLPSSTLFGEATPDIDVSPQQMEKMEGLMNEMQKFYNELSPEERAQFEAELTAEVEKEQRKLESMDPEEQKKYIESAFKTFDEIDLEEISRGQEEIEQPELEPTPIPEVNETDKSEKLAAAEETEKQKIKKMIDTINAIIKILESLSEKLASIMPNPQDLIDKWIKKGYIPIWAGDESNWNTFKKTLDGILQRLHKLKDTDPKTKAYKFIGEPKATESLLGKLELMLTTLRKYEPKIEITTAGKVKTRESKDALKRTINYLVEYTEMIINNVDKLIEKYDPTAKKIRAQEEAAAKKAARYKKKTYPERPVVAGSTDRQESYDDLLRRYYGDDSMPTYDEDYPATMGSEDWEPSPEELKTPEKSTSTGTEKKSKKKKSDKEDEKYMKDESLNRAVKFIEDKLGTLDSFMQSTEGKWQKKDGKIGGLQAFLEEGDKDNEFIKGITEATENIKMAKRRVSLATKNIKDLKNKNAQDAYKRKLLGLRSTYKQEVLDPIFNEIKSINDANIPNDIRQLYLGQSLDLEQQVQLERQVLQSRINENQEAIANIQAQGQQQPETQQMIQELQQTLTPMQIKLQSITNLGQQIETSKRNIENLKAQPKTQATTQQITQAEQQLKTQEKNLKKIVIPEISTDLRELGKSISDLINEFEKLKK